MDDVFKFIKAPRNRAALKRQESFNVVSRRDFDLTNRNEIPGPGAYDQSMLRSKASVAKLSDRRWKDTRDYLPGPGAYELSPVYQDTILKGTFNATLNNPLATREKQRVAGSESVISNKLTIEHLGRSAE